MWRQINAGELNLKKYDLVVEDLEDCEKLKPFMAARLKERRKEFEKKQKELAKLAAAEQARLLKIAEEKRLAEEAKKAAKRCIRQRAKKDQAIADGTVVIRKKQKRVVDMAYGITYDVKPKALDTCEGLDSWNTQRNNARCTQKRQRLNKMIYTTASLIFTTIRSKNGNSRSVAL